MLENILGTYQNGKCYEYILGQEWSTFCSLFESVQPDWYYAPFYRMAKKENCKKSDLTYKFKDSLQNIPSPIALMSSDVNITSGLSGNDNNFLVAM